MKRHILFVALQAVGLYNNLVAMEKKSNLTQELWQKTENFKEDFKKEKDDKSIIKGLDPKDYDHVAAMLCLKDIIKNGSKRSEQEVFADVKIILDYMNQNKYDINKEFFKSIGVKSSTDIFEPYQHTGSMPYVESPLFAACREKNCDVIKTLLEFKADPNYKSVTTYGNKKQKETVLSVANSTGNKDVMNLIKGAIDEKKPVNKIKRVFFTLKKE